MIKMNFLQKIFLIIAAIVFIALFAFLPFLHNHTPTLDEPLNCPAYILEMSLISALGLLLLAAIVYLSSHWLLFANSHTRFPSNQNYSLFLNRAPPQS